MGNEKRPVALYLQAHSEWTPPEREDFARFYAHYYGLIDRDRAAVAGGLGRLEAGPQVPFLENPGWAGLSKVLFKLGGLAWRDLCPTPGQS